MKTKVITVLAIFSMFGCTTDYTYKQSSVVSNPYHAPKISYATKATYLHLINEVRSHGRSCGSRGYFSSAPALRWSDTLYKASYEHSQDMREKSYFSHNGSGTLSDWTSKVEHLQRGSSFRERIENNGYKNWSKIAENIEGGSPTPQQAIAHWLKSDYHCANMMNPLFTDVGMAEVGHLWTQDFARHQ